MVLSYAAPRNSVDALPVAGGDIKWVKHTLSSQIDECRSISIFRYDLSRGIHRLVQQITPGGDAYPSVAASS
jgi:hypothetical protein